MLSRNSWYAAVKRRLMCPYLYLISDSSHAVRFCFWFVLDARPIADVGAGLNLVSIQRTQRKVLTYVFFDAADVGDPRKVRKRAVAAISSKPWGDDMASAEREPIVGVCRVGAPSGVQGQSP